MVWQIIGPVSNVHRRFHVDGIAYFPHAGGYQQEMHVGLQNTAGMHAGQLVLGCMLVFKRCPGYIPWLPWLPLATYP